MLVILPEPSKTTEFETLAVNIDAHESLIIRRVDNVFQLATQKHYDGLFTQYSAVFFVLANLDSYNACKDLFQAIIKSIESGDKVFHIDKYLNKVDLKNMEIPSV